MVIADPFTRVLVKTIEGGSYVPSKSHGKSVDSGIGRGFSSYLPPYGLSLPGAWDFYGSISHWRDTTAYST